MKFFAKFIVFTSLFLIGLQPCNPHTIEIKEHTSTIKILVISVDGSINPSSAEYIHSGIKKAENINAECLIIKLNTPGGLLKSTRMIVTDLLNSNIPIIVYVTPSGSQSASAGVFITLAAHIAVMAPGTNIGAAHPVTLQGQQDSIMNEKATNDAAAFIRTISEKRSRNIQWAEDAVRKSISITETEALKQKVIDTIAVSIQDLLEKIHGKKITTAAGLKILNTQNAEIVDLEMSFQEKILDLLSDPNIAYILFMIGIYGIMFELYNPGSIFPGVVGAISMILAFYSMHTLPINYAGLALIILAVILFILEIKIISHGLLTIGGIISLILGSIMLIDTESTLEVLKISWQVIAISVILTSAFFIFAIGLGIKAQLRKPTTGIEGLIGEIGETITDLNPEGKVRVHGEFWNAESTEGLISQGSKIKVTGLENLKLKVRKVQ
jgi:membrane-bound serine protease (ClpP class)